MTREKKRGFFSQLGPGQRGQTSEKETEVQNEQPVVGKIIQVQEPVKASEHAVEKQPQTHTETRAETFAADVVEVTGQVAESKKAQPEAEVVAQPRPVVEETPEPVATEREELPLSESVNAGAVSSEEWQAEAETIEIIEAVGEEAAKEEVIDEEPEAQVLVTEMTEETVIMVSSVEEDQPAEEIVQEREEPTKGGFFARLKRSLLKTRENLGFGFISLFHGKKINDDLFEESEEQLLITDMGVETTRKIITNLIEDASHKQFRDAKAPYDLLKEEMGEILMKADEPLNVEGKAPFAILVVGVNGVGKITTTGKLTCRFEQQGKSVMLMAGGTLRVVAVEQPQAWGQRSNIPMIVQHTGADSTSVIPGVIQVAKARNVGVLTADTAGRSQNKSHLMEGLRKVVHVMKKLDIEAPYEVVPIIDTGIGRNAVNRAKLFHEAVDLTDITLTKLDDVAKGGVTFSVTDQFGIPIHYIDVGEHIKDLYPFKAGDSMEVLLARED